MNIKNILIIIFFLIYASAIFAQKPQVQINGFIRNDSVLSTRQAIYLSQTLSSVIFPVPKEINTFNEDPYSQPSASLMNFFPSITILVDQIDFFSGTMETYLNADFIGFKRESSQLAILNFFNRVHWCDHSLLFGYAPHPLISPDIYPNTVNANYSNPITPFSINPQIKYCWEDEHVVFKGTFYSEYLFTNDGPGIPDYPFNFKSTRFSNTYIRNAFAPSTNITLELFDNNVRIGIAGDVSFHRPRLFNQIPNPITFINDSYAVNQFIKSFKFNTYLGTTIKHMAINFQYMYGQNGMDIQSLGGYAALQNNSQLTNHEYTNIDFSSYWIDINYVKHAHVQPGLYIGYAQNLGSKKQLAQGNVLDDTYFSIDRYISVYFPLTDGFTNKILVSMLRIVPRLWIYPHEKLAIGIETEWIKTGNENFSQCIRPKNLNKVYNWMLHGILSVQYMF